jgi:nicotinamidase-related amidase
VIELSENRRPFKLLLKPYPKFNIKSTNVVLLILDAQKLLMDPKGGFGRLIRLKGIESEFYYYYKSLHETIPNIKKILTKCREIGAGIIFTRMLTVDDEIPNNFIQRLDVLSLEEDDGEIIDNLAPNNEEVIIDKKCENPFNMKELELILKDMDARYLIICGVRTPGPLNTVALDAADKGYGVIVVSDACTGGVPNGHRFLSGGLIKIRSTEAVLEMLSEIN